MFAKRDQFPDNDEIRRQQVAVDILTDARRPITLFEKKVAALVGCSRIDPLRQLAARKRLDRILATFNDEQDLYERGVREKIRDILNETRPEIGDTIRLPVKAPIFTLPLEQAPRYDYTLETTLAPINGTANLREFEQLCFNGRTLYRFYENTNFAAYLFQNLLYSLNVTDVNQLLDNQQWQAKLACLLYETRLNNLVAVSAFYEDRVRYRDAVYDTSYVPKYDVKNLKPVNRIYYERDTNLDRRMLEYYYNLDVSAERQVPPEYLGFFLTFPFKQGFYVQPNGNIIYLNIEPVKKRTVNKLMRRLCTVFELESMIDYAARALSYGDALAYAVHAPNHMQQGLALLVLRRMVGNYLHVDPYVIPLPSEYDVLSWNQIVCRSMGVVLPIGTTTDNGEGQLIDMIRDVARSCGNEHGASMICSSFRLPEASLYRIFRALSTDAERYVFYTILMQEYRAPMFDAARNELRPEFGRDTIDVVGTYGSLSPPRRYIDTTVDDRLDSYTELLLRPTDVTVFTESNCTPIKCPELYRFTDPQLAELIETERVDMNDDQLAAFIALCVQ